MRFTEELRESAAKSWEQSINHPFVQGVVRGELPLDKFKFYILQDIYYLKHYGKIHALAAAQAEDFKITAMLADKEKLTAEAELTVHEEHAKILKISDEEMEDLQPAPTAYAYTSHLYRAAGSGSLGQTIAAILPCYWLYADIGKIFQDAKPEEPIYQNWIQTYASEWFHTSTQEMIDLLDEIAEKSSEKEKEKMEEQFLIAKEYELSFWEMSYTKEQWLSEKKDGLNV